MGLRGAFQGAISAGLANKLGGIGPKLIRVMSHGVSQGVLNKAVGGDFRSGFVSAIVGSLTPGYGEPGLNVAVASAAGGVSAELSGGKFADGAITAGFSYLFVSATSSRHGPSYDEGEGGTAFVGGFFDKTINGPVLSAYENFNGSNKAYFQWYQREPLGKWIDANAGNVDIIGHSWGGDLAAEVVAAGHAVNALTTVDPVGWTRPDFAAVTANTGSWVNYNAIGGGAAIPNIVARIGGAWNNAPPSTINVPHDHATACAIYCNP